MVKWRFATGDYVYSSSAVVDGVVYVGSDDGYVYALSAADGSERWRFAASDGVWSSPAVVDGVVYVGSDDGYVYALDAADGSERWHFVTDSAVESSPAVVDGVVYVGTFDTNVYALQAADGSELWHFATDGGEVPSSPMVVNGVVYVGSVDGCVYAFGNLMPMVLASDVVVRAAPSASGVERGEARKGSEVSDIGQREERDGIAWVEVTIEGMTGWIPLDAIDPATLPPDGEIEYVYRP